MTVVHHGGHPGGHLNHTMIICACIHHCLQCGLHAVEALGSIAKPLPGCKASSSTQVNRLRQVKPDSQVKSAAMQRLLRTLLLRDHQRAQSLWASGARQPQVVQQCLASLRLLPDPAVTLASRSFASSAEDGGPASDSPSSAQTNLEESEGQAVEGSQADHAGTEQASINSQEDDPIEAAEAAEEQSDEKATAAAPLKTEDSKYRDKGPGGLDFHIGDHLMRQACSPLETRWCPASCYLSHACRDIV